MVQKGLTASLIQLYATIVGEVSDTIVFLASDEVSAINGSRRGIIRSTM